MVLRQALGRLPWFAAFFLRARRFRPVLLMGDLLVDRPPSLPGVETLTKSSGDYAFFLTLILTVAAVLSEFPAASVEVT